MDTSLVIQWMYSMKIRDFNQSAPTRGLPPQQVIHIGDGRKEKMLEDKIAALETALEASQRAFQDASLLSKQARVEMGQEAVQRRDAEHKVETLTAITNQQKMWLDEVQDLKGLLHVEQMAREKAERQARINSTPRFMSMGAIESSTGFKMPGFGSIIPRKHLGGGQPNLVQYRVKEN